MLDANSADFYKAEGQQRNRGDEDVYQGNITLVEWLPEL